MIEPRITKEKLEHFQRTIVDFHRSKLIIYDPQYEFYDATRQFYVCTDYDSYLRRIYRGSKQTDAVVWAAFAEAKIRMVVFTPILKCALDRLRKKTPRRSNDPVFLSMVQLDTPTIRKFEHACAQGSVLGLWETMTRDPAPLLARVRLVG